MLQEFHELQQEVAMAYVHAVFGALRVFLQVIVVPLKDLKDRVA